MENCYVYLSFGHKSFTTGKIAIVKILDAYMFVNTYVDIAKKKVCEELGLNEEEVVIFDSKFLGEDVVFC